MKEENLWREFWATGSVESYLRYATSKGREKNRKQKKNSGGPRAEA
ncbi:MAG: hypothetical protein IKS27_04950 [Oscillospiraceae bacterium]|nr:hypothetical protein [Oscillospiraceae bacterium]MBR6430539.1 hypothetical protein [Oscillospiraceae bacterium]